MAELVDALVSNTSELNPRAGSTPAPGTKASAQAGAFSLMFYVYIIYSKLIDKYYFGSTSDLATRLSEHNQGVYTGSFTKRSADWEYFLVITCIHIIHARKVEAHIKKMHSRKYIENLHKYESMREALVRRYL